MTFDEILDQAIEMLQRRGRLTYRALQRQFKLDDAYLEDLKDELIEGQRLAADENGRVIVWTGDTEPPVPKASRETNAEARFHAILPALTCLLQRERRLTYRILKQIFVPDENLLEDLRKELTLRRLAIDEDGEVLVWTGDRRRVVQPDTVTSRSPDTSEAVPVLSSPSSEPVPVTTEAATTGAEQVVPSEPVRMTPDAERRQLTVMFCDLADSTKLSQRLDPEDLREVVRAYQATAAEVIQQYGGHIAQYLGDGLLIYFGWPTAHEDDAQRALHAGLGIVNAITTTLNPRLEQDKGVQLALRIGIHTGTVVVGQMGGGGRHENLATGETVNIAARLEGLAEPNTVLISSVTARLVERAFVLEALEPQILKGVADPMDVFRVLDAMADDEDETATVGIHFLVGRDEEVGLLLRRWEQAKEGLGQVVLISGEAGIGKSSQVSTVRHHVLQAENTCMTFRCSPYHTNSALYPVIDHVQRVLQFQSDDTPATRLDKLERVLSGYSRPLEEVVPLYADLLSVPLPEGRYAPLHLTSQQQRQQTQDALVGWLLEKAERQPALVIWEDLHWADPSTLEMLGLALEQTPTVPMLHVLTFRPEFTPPWPTRSHMTPLALNRLERPQVEALIMYLAAGKMLPAEVVEHIVAKTDGVPLYVEELTKMFMESGLLRAEPDQYVLTGLLTKVAIPDTLQDSLMARLDQISQAKEVAQLGSVLGREFDYEMLQPISSQDDETLQAGLSQLVEAELLYQRGRPPRAKYIFKHALIQDAAYASLLRSTRQQLHRQIAQVLEAQFSETAANQPELVAYHYTEAECNERAIGYWQRAGARAVEHSAHTEAIHHLTQALVCLATLPETQARHQHELELRLALGPVLNATKSVSTPEVEQNYVRARELCEQLPETPQLFLVLRGLWMYYMTRGELQTSRGLEKQLLQLAEEMQEPVHLSSAHQAIGSTVFWLGKFSQARTHFEQAVMFYQALPPDPLTFQEDGTNGPLSLAWLLPGPRHRPPPASQILGTARRHQPGPPVAEPGQAPGCL